MSQIPNPPVPARSGLCAFLVAFSWALSLRAQPASLAPASGAEAPGGSSLLAGSDWRCLVGGSAQLTYDSNPFIQPSNGRSDEYLDVAPTLAVGLGDFRPEILPFADIPHFLARTDTLDIPDRDLVFLSYTPDFQWWRHSPHNDTVNEDVRAEARKVTERLDLAAVLRVQSIASPDIDVGQRLRQVYDTADVTGQYALTGRTNVGAELYGGRSAYSGGLTSWEWRGTAFADESIAPKTSAGLAVAVGTLTISGGPTQVYERPLVRWAYLPTGKLSFSGDLGVEFRSFQGARGRRRDGVVDFSSTYRATDSTDFSLSGQRQTQASALAGDQDLEQTLVQAQVRQRLFQQLYGKLAGGYARDSYYANTLTPTLPRRDDYTFVRVSAAHDLTRHGTVEVAYEHRNNDSTDASFGFAESLASVEASFLY